VSDLSAELAELEPRQITAALVERARLHAMETGESLMLAMQSITAWDGVALMDAIGGAMAYPVFTLAVLRELAPRFDRISYRESSERRIVAGVRNDERDVLVLANPFDGYGERWALRTLENHGVVQPLVALAHPDDLAIYLAEQEAALQAIDSFNSIGSALDDGDGCPVISLSSIDADESPAVKLVNSTIYDALKLQASDIHLECDADSLHVQYRIDGVLVPITRVAGLSLAEQIISRIKVMAELDIAERRVPQDGRFKVRVDTREIDFRVSIMPNIFGEDAVLRLLDRRALTEAAQSLRLDHLGLDAQSMAQIRQLAAKPHGMLLVTGPTGSGKTTTLYAAISEIHTGRDKIVTIEDPVEYRLPRVLQIPVNERKGLTFARGLRSLLRHDPDKIMVGEIRDDETAQIAVQAALTGHLLLTTVHANSVYDVLGRFLHMGVDPYSFAAALNGIVAQRLLRLNCPHCATACEPVADELKAIGLSIAEVSGWRWQAGAGCAHCRGTGYKGRHAIAEVLVLDDRLRELIAERAPVSSLKALAGETGLKPMRETALARVAAGETTLAEVLRVAG
jgi:general secretion pathway protein E